MAINPMQQQQSPDMLMAMMTDPRATPQQRMAAMSALNAMRGGANAPQPPQMTGDSTGVSDMDPAFMAAVRQEMTGQGPEAQPEIAQRQAAPEAPQNPSTEALMSGAADASRVAAMAQGGAVRHYENGTDGNDPSSYNNLENLSLPELVNIIEDPTTEPSVRARAISKATISRQVAPPVAAPPPEAVSMPPPQARMQQFAMQAPSMPDVNIEQPEPDPAAGQEKPARPAGRDYYALLEKMAEEGDSGAIPAKDKYMALLQAGLGTMAAASQPGAKFLGSIGQGGLMGVKELQEAKAARAQDRMKKISLYGTLATHQENIAEKIEAREDKMANALAERIQRAELAGNADDTRRLGIEANALSAKGQLALQGYLAQLQGQKLTEDKEKYANRPLDTATSRIVNSSLDLVDESRNAASRYLELSKKINEVKPTEGFGGNVKEWAKKTAGIEDLESSIKNDFGQIMKEMQLSRLPRGPASDKDIKFVEAYMLNPSSNNQEKMRVLQVMANLKTDLANRKQFEAEFAEKQFRSGQQSFSAGGLDFSGGITKAEAFKAWNEANPYTPALPDLGEAGPNTFKTDDSDFNEAAAKY